MQRNKQKQRRSKKKNVALKIVSSSQVYLVFTLKLILITIVLSFTNTLSRTSLYFSVRQT